MGVGQVGKLIFGYFIINLGFGEEFGEEGGWQKAGKMAEK